MISSVSVEDKSLENPDGAVTTQFSMEKLNKAMEKLNIGEDDKPVA